METSVSEPIAGATTLSKRPRQSTTMARPARSFLSKALVLAVAVALASAGLAQAGICDDGGDPDATTGCCSNNKCPTCCTMTSEAQSGDGPKTCTCTGCTGAQVFGES